MEIVIEPLRPSHDRASFSCGQPDLDDWFRRRAGQDERRNIARVFVAADKTHGVIGFYSLSTCTLAITDLPNEIAKKLPRYDMIAAALIGRLARDKRVSGQGVGELLLADAIHRILGAGRSLAVFAIIVEAKDQRAADFYKSHSFHSFPLHPRRLFLLTETAYKAWAQA